LVEASASVHQEQRASQCNPLLAPSSLFEVNLPLARAVTAATPLLSAPRDVEVAAP
jgi:hypothetical protein